MFGDLGQGLCLCILGFLCANKKISLFKNYRNFAGPLKIIGAAAMFTGLLYGSVFSNEEILREPTLALTRALSQTQIGSALHIMPTEKILDIMPEGGGENGSGITKLFYFFGFTLALGFILNSIGLIFNIIDNFVMHRYRNALFAKNGIAGLIFFWYAVSIALRAIIGAESFKFMWYDAAVLIFSLFVISCSHFIWSLFAKHKHEGGEESGIFTKVMEVIVEIIETASGYFSNSVSFLRVGAFALSHTILSFIIFEMADIVKGADMGGLWSLIIIIAGNALIIVLEGMIVAIQVVRLEYYEFFSKFFTQTGIKFTPFTFQNIHRS
jgi:V/A-type H+-transporting ATPase subunit I